MRTLSIALAALSLALALAAGASAQDAGSPIPRVESFDDEIVSGTYDSPWADRLTGHLRGRRTTLIQPRSTYIPELLVSVEDL